MAPALMLNTPYAVPDYPGATKTVTSVRRDLTDSQIAIRATYRIAYPDAATEEGTVTFTAPRHGAPGPVHIYGERGLHTPIDDPARFGDALTEEFALAFLLDAR